MNLVCMLFCTSLVALVGGGDHPSLSPRHLSIVNTKRENIITQMTFMSKILSIKLNRKRLMVVLQERIHLYDITNMKEIHTIDTPSNPRGNMLILMHPVNLAA
jgi:autophagy-related protein 18